MSNLVFTPQALKVLKSFAQINVGMLFKPNHKFEVAHKSKTVIGLCDVGVVIPERFAIQDMKKFLGVISLHDKDTVQFDLGGNVIKIKSKKGVTTYRLTDPTNVTHLPDNFNLPMIEKGKFKITASELEEIGVIATSLNLPHVVFGSDPTEHLTIDIKDIKDDGTDFHDLKSNSEASGEFSMTVKTENLLNLMFLDYEVKVSSKFLYFQSTDKTSEYYVSVEPD